MCSGAGSGGAGTCRPEPPMGLGLKRVGERGPLSDAAPGNGLRWPHGGRSGAPGPPRDPVRARLLQAEDEAFMSLARLGESISNLSF